MKNLTVLVSLAFLTSLGCRNSENVDLELNSAQEARVEILYPMEIGVLNTAFVIAPGVYNSELMAPYDVFQHTIFRDSLNYMSTYIVAEELSPIMTFEGIEVIPHYNFDSAPKTDILVIPSTLHSMDSDLVDPEYMAWIKQAATVAKYVITVCDGAFPLAQTGLLNGRVATTFPSDREQFAEMFEEIEVLFDKRVVVDGKFVTSVGGAMSYEPAFYLVEKLYGKDNSDRIAEGLVWDWDLSHLPVFEK